MSARKPALPKVLDLPALLGAALTVGFYLVVNQESMKETLVYRYTTEHAVEYVIVWFFIWGIVDTVFRALTFPREMLALRQVWLPSQPGRQPVSTAATIFAHLQKKPVWLRESRMGQRLMQALTHLKDQGSAEGFGDYLKYLSEQDDDKTHINYGLIRFICWVTPMLGFLGTVVHFGTALGGHSAGDIGEKLPTVVAEMGTAFNTTTVALVAATSMMFGLFLCERTERGILHTIDRRVERELLHRFEVADANMTPFLAALHSASEANMRAMDTTIERQLAIWSQALEGLQQQSEQRQRSQATQWEQALGKLEARLESGEAQRESRMLRLLEATDMQRQEHRAQTQQSVDQIAGLQADFARLVEGLSGVVQGKGEIVKLQAVLADNLRVLRETQQIDQALHGLTAAIHLLTARNQPPSLKEHRAA